MTAKKSTVSILLTLIMLLCTNCSFSEPVNNNESTATVQSSQTVVNTTTSEKAVQTTDDIINSMTMHEKICQLFVVTPEQLTCVEGVTAADKTTKKSLKKYPVGGIVYFSGNIVSEEQLTEMTKNSQSYSKIPLLIATDEEGGDVARIAGTLDVAQLQPMFNYKDEGEEVARQNAETIAKYLKKYGINTDFAPIADVWSNPDNSVIGTRAYSNDFSQAEQLVASAVKGFKSQGEICTLKHFPGHGDTTQDSHEQLAHITRSVEQIKSEEFSVFRSGIEAGADMVMVGHLIIDELGDNTPATLNKNIVTDMLRDELGFNGVAITDSMEMGAIADNYGIGNASVMAIEAGIDMILMPSNLSEAVSAVEQAVTDGTLTEKRIDESLQRIINMKIDNNIFKGIIG